MVLVDTSIWIDHFRGIERRLSVLLQAGRVLSHGAVIGELACGQLRQRTKIIPWLRLLTRSQAASESEALQLIEDKRLFARGLGWVDVQLLASALVTGCSLWTSDAALRRSAEQLGLSYRPQ